MKPLIKKFIQRSITLFFLVQDVSLASLFSNTLKLR
jgi:hypothetical protein